MNDFAPIIIFIIVVNFLLALAKSKKNKAAVKHTPSDAERRMQEFKTFIGATPAQPIPAKKEDDRFAPHWEPSPAPFAAPAPQPTPARMGVEGEDACHEYMLPTEEEQQSVKPLAEGGGNEELAQDLVKGVIISEILRRPQPYGRRRA